MLDFAELYLASIGAAKRNFVDDFFGTFTCSSRIFVLGEGVLHCLWLCSEVIKIVTAATEVEVDAESYSCQVSQ